MNKIIGNPTTTPMKAPTSAIRRLTHYGDADIVPSDKSLFSNFLEVKDDDGNLIGYGAYWNPITYASNELIIPYEHNGFPVVRLVYGIEHYVGNLNIERVIIPNTVKEIETLAFRKLGITEVTVPDSVEYMESGEFRECSKLQSVIFSKKMSLIPDTCFYGCSALKTITLGRNINHIGGAAFGGCESLTDVYFEGSKSQWEAITIREANEALLNATIHFGECEGEGVGTSDFVVAADLVIVDEEPTIENVSATFEDIKNAYVNGQSVVLKVTYLGHAEVTAPMLSISEAEAYFVLAQSVLPHLAEIVIRDGEEATLLVTRFTTPDEVMDYVEERTGDVETALENIIKKYGLGGDAQ